MSHSPVYHYRAMTAADVEPAHALSAALNWSHRVEDWTVLQRCAQGFVAEHEGRLIGTAFACNQGGFSSIGLVIVAKAYQGRGIGRALMHQALAAAAPRTAILTATVEGAPLYTKLGFVPYGQVEQWQGRVPATGVGMPHAGSRDLTHDDWPRSLALASAASGLDRGRVLTELLPSVTRGIVIEHQGALQAFALLRPFGRGLAIGPVVAHNVEQAAYMVQALLHIVPGRFVRIDTPADSGLGCWLETFGLKWVDTVTRMTRGAVPMPAGGVYPFGLITQAVG